ncbi:hypothetical protein [Variovorax sp. PAMC26660]|uniref:hypothetical protein n=1 Tax=Variovorax sp. PAMC26660 TaxID=2762322 RepID=UPI00164D0041|nr:hypothetical protein [Variovorax sp. PAMC26660]QNK65823.1 hypothetical protein H7F35_21740 [Variovorax sp. PAMC26660]
MKRKCTCCGKQFRLKTNPDQAFCSEAACQRERKLRWQRHKLRADPDYVENKRNAQKKWVAEHPEYWRHYRQRRNVDSQPPPGEPPAKSEAAQVVKKDASTSQIPLPTGLYWVQAIAPMDPAKNDAFMVEIHFVSSTWPTSAKNDGIDAAPLAAYLPVSALSTTSVRANGCAPERPMSGKRSTKQ